MKKLKIILLFSLLFVILFKFFHPSESILKDEKNFEGIITNIKYSSCTTLEVKTKEKLLVYDCNNGNYKYGDKIKFKGELEKPKNTFTFNYEKYLLSKNIHYVLYAKNIEIISHSKNIFYILKNKLNDKIADYKSKDYVKAFVLGGTDLIDEDVFKSYLSNGISHLFAISGMHITLLSSILYFLLNIFFKKKTSFRIISLILLFYIFITNFSPSVIRAVLMFILLNKSLDKIIFLFLIFLALNPFYIYNLGFCYSYVVTFFLICFKEKLKNKNFLFKTFTISFIAFLAGMPITIMSNNCLNLLSALINVLFVPLVSSFIYPFSLITYFIKPFDIPFSFIMDFFEKISLFFSEIDFFTLTLRKINIICFFLYYIIIFLSLKKSKFYLILIFILIVHSHINIVDKNSYITFIDVGQGDSIFLKDKNKNILIDTGGNELGGNYSTKRIIPYLKYMGVEKLDYLILTHGDFDHMGESINLVKNFKVDKVVFNNNSFNENEKNLINVLKSKKINYLKNVKKINPNIYFLNDNLYDNENDNSLVIYIKINQKKILLMGDASENVENDLIGEYNLNNIDILKVGHHGSKTSSSKDFVDTITPKYSVISVGKNNRYGHPHTSVLENLRNSTIYRTDKEGSIMFKFKKNKIILKTCN